MKMITEEGHAGRSEEIRRDIGAKGRADRQRVFVLRVCNCKSAPEDSLLVFIQMAEECGGKKRKEREKVEVSFGAQKRDLIQFTRADSQSKY